MTTTVIIAMVVFFIAQQIMVILSTMRTILTVTASPTVAMIINTTSYTLYAGIVKLISGQELWFVLVVTAVTNIIGVYIAKAIVNKMTKDKMWIFNATVNTEKCSVKKVIAMLEDAEIEYLYNELTSGKFYSLQIFANTQKESAMIIEILKNYNVKYYATETK